MIINSINMATGRITISITTTRKIAIIIIRVLAFMPDRGIMYHRA